MTKMESGYLLSDVRLKNNSNGSNSNRSKGSSSVYK